MRTGCAIRQPRNCSGPAPTLGNSTTPAPSPCVDYGDLRQGGPHGPPHDHPPVAGRCGMSQLRQSLVDYLAVRRALGYKLDKPAKLLTTVFHERPPASSGTE